MRLPEGDVVCGCAAATARAAVRELNEAQWCSAGALARRLDMDPAACRTLLEALEADGYLNKPYRGRLPEAHAASGCQMRSSVTSRCCCGICAIRRARAWPRPASAHPRSGHSADLPMADSRGHWHALLHQLADPHAGRAHARGSARSTAGSACQEPRRGHADSHGGSERCAGAGECGGRGGMGEVKREPRRGGNDHGREDDDRQPDRPVRGNLIPRHWTEALP